MYRGDVEAIVMVKGRSWGKVMNVREAGWRFAWAVGRFGSSQVELVTYRRDPRTESRSRVRRLLTRWVRWFNEERYG